MSVRFRHPNGIYELSVPDNWQHEVRGSSVIFSNANKGGGAVVVSCLAPPAGEPSDAKAFILDFVAKKLRPEEGPTKDCDVRIVELRSQNANIKTIYTSYR